MQEQEKMSEQSGAGHVLESCRVKLNGRKDFSIDYGTIWQLSRTYKLLISK